MYYLIIVIQLWCYNAVPLVLYLIFDTSWQVESDTMPDLKKIALSKNCRDFNYLVCLDISVKMLFSILFYELSEGYS